MTAANILYNTVIKNGYCIGCGACACVHDSPFAMNMDKYGLFVAVANQSELDLNKSSVLEVCPFSDISKNEDEISDIFFPDTEAKHIYLGKYLHCFAGYVNEGDFRTLGSSGGIAKWLGYRLLKEGEIDCFIQVVPNSTNDAKELLFDYQIFHNCDDIYNGSKSAYYPTTLVNIIGEIENTDGKYAVTAVPCNIKAIRMLSLKNETIKRRIKYTIGIVCGGMKSANYAKLVGWELGIHPQNLVKIEFRRKYENRPANEKIYQVWSSQSEITKFRDVSQIYGTGYASGFFKPKACDYCDDVFAETADIAIGDAWLKKYVKDPKGTFLIVVRNRKLLDILKNAQENNRIFMEPINAEEAAYAQKGGLRHRRDALSRRIAKKEKKNEWVPPKRIKANQFKMDNKRQKIYDLREKIAERSHIAFFKALEKNKLAIFHREMNPLIFRFAIANLSELLPSLPRRTFLYLKNSVQKIIGGQK